MDWKDGDIIPIDKWVCSRGLVDQFRFCFSPITVITYEYFNTGHEEGIRQKDLELFNEVVTVNPILSMLGLVRFDKNAKRLRPQKKIVFDSEDAERIYRRIEKMSDGKAEPDMIILRPATD